MDYLRKECVFVTFLQFFSTLQTRCNLSIGWDVGVSQKMLIHSFQTAAESGILMNTYTRGGKNHLYTLNIHHFSGCLLTLLSLFNLTICCVNLLTLHVTRIMWSINVLLQILQTLDQQVDLTKSTIICFGELNWNSFPSFVMLSL